VASIFARNPDKIDTSHLILENTKQPHVSEGKKNCFPKSNELAVNYAASFTGVKQNSLKGYFTDLY
jgi:hypothetical protein